MSAAGPPPKSPASFSVPTGAAKRLVVKLEPVRIRVLDRFGEPYTDEKCSVAIPDLGKRDKPTDDKGWLEVRCPKGTAYVDLQLVDVAGETTRRVLLAPAPDDDADGTKQRLFNLGFFGGRREREDARRFQRAHGLDTAEEDLNPHLGDIESDYKTLDEPLEQETSPLDEQVHDLADEGERT
jgi:hypothetical protein